MTQETFSHTTTRKVIKSQADYNALLVEHANVPHEENEKLLSNIKAMRIIRFALPPDTFRLVSTCTTSKEIWDRLKELYSKDADLEHSLQTTLLSEFDSFVQKPDEKLDQTFNCCNHLLSRMLKYNIERRFIEHKVTFMNGLRSEWKAIVSTVKAHEKFKSYSPAMLVEGCSSSSNKARDDVSRTLKLMKRKRRRKFLVILAMNAIIVMARITLPINTLLRRMNEKKSYAIDGGQNSESCFAAKTVSERVSECERVIDKLHLDCEIGKGLHNTVLPFLELKEDEIHTDGYKCESIISSDEDKDQIKSDTLQKFDLLCNKLNLENTFNTGNVFEFDESDMSEIFVEDEIDCSVFVQNTEEPKKNLISENSIEFICIVENKGSKVLNEKATIFLKVQTVPNQVFVKNGLTKKDTLELTSLVNNDNVDGCDEYFWFGPTENVDEIKSLSEMTSWKTKGKYVSKPLNRVDLRYDQAGPSGMNDFPSETYSKQQETPDGKEKHKFNVYMFAEEIVAKKSSKYEFFSIQKPKSKPFSKPQISKPQAKSKVVSEREISLKEYEANLKKEEKEFAKKMAKKTKEFIQRKANVVEIYLGTGIKVSFDDEGSEIIEKKPKAVLLKSKRKGEMYSLNLKPINRKPSNNLLTKAFSDDSWLCHQRISHMNFKDINKLVLGDLVCGIPLLKFGKEHLRAACELGKQSRTSHSTIINTKIIERLELMHIDFCGPSAIKSIGGNKYILVVVDDFSRFTWMFFLRQKSDATLKRKDFIKQIDLQL
ncbi:uncharacterized protein LOC111909749 [Lactuca sativa]|uniref:uncharacterized protein LOC111909749 n=1 Tax=Lactuca sativa TaxID=4236 RepID=UPI0022AF8835|nr:uncharacterized protein LOC111909749 [Lactuca sativa]